jgi:hypothetical protein
VPYILSYIDIYIDYIYMWMPFLSRTATLGQPNEILNILYICENENARVRVRVTLTLTGSLLTFLNGQLRRRKMRSPGETQSMYFATLHHLSVLVVHLRQIKQTVMRVVGSGVPVGLRGTFVLVLFISKTYL